MKKHNSRTLHVSQKVMAWVLTFVIILGLIPFGSLNLFAAEVHSTGYTYGVDEDTFNDRFDKIWDSVYLGEYDISGHVQGVAVDDELKYMYAPFTQKLVKIDLETNEVVGVVSGWGEFGADVHLGDAAYYDGRIYSGMEFRNEENFYVAVFDCDKIVGEVDYRDCMSAMWLSEVTKDRQTTINGEQYAYGAIGVDGIAFGSIPGDDSGEIVMMVAVNIQNDATDKVGDRNYQILLQYSLDSFLESDGNGGTQLKEGVSGIVERPDPHRYGPAHEDKYFVLTGNTDWGVQNLEYDAVSNNYIMAMYPGSLPEWPNYYTYYVDASVAPVVQDLVMDPERLELYKQLENTNPDCTHMGEGKVLTLADNNGSSDGSATLDYKDCVGPDGNTYRIWGKSYSGFGNKMGQGLEHIYGDYFYIRDSIEALEGGATGTMDIYKYDRDNDTFTAVDRNLKDPVATKILSYSMDAADLYTEDGVTYLKNGVEDSKYAAIVEGTNSDVGVSGTAGQSLAFNAWNYPAEPDQVYLDDDTIAYMNEQIANANYSYSYSFWAKIKTGNDAQNAPFIGMYREDGTYLSVYELRGTAMRYAVNGVGNKYSASNPGDGGTGVTKPDNISGAGMWNFYTVTEFNDEITIYENGVKKYTTRAWNPYHYEKEPTADFIIGGGLSKIWKDENNRGRLIGSVDDVTIYSGVLTADQVAAEYNKVTDKETSGVDTVTEADDTVQVDENIVYLNYDLTKDKDKDLVYDYGATVESWNLENMTKGTDYTVNGTELTLKASWLGTQNCGKIEIAAGDITIVLTITDTTEPVLSYSFDSDSLNGTVVKDDSNYGVDAIANNITTFGEDHTGSVNGSFTFNGYDYKNPTYVRLSDQDAAWLSSVLDNGYTINFWAKPTAENGNMMTYAGFYDSVARPLGVVETNDTVNGELNTETATDGIISLQGTVAKSDKSTQTVFCADITDTNLWAMHTLSYDKDTKQLKLYLEGMLLDSITVEDDIIGEIDALFIGHTYKKYFSGTTNIRGGFCGLMDNFQVYNYALSDADVKTLATDGILKDDCAVYYEDISVYRAESGYTAPDAPEGYIFAGWYKDEACTKENAVQKGETKLAAYAKFVDAKLLTVKAQITAGTTAESESTSIRFVTAIDNKNYRKIGFKINIYKDSGIDERDYSDNIVYKRLSVMVDEKTTKYTPQNLFCATATFFRAQIINKVPKANFDTEFEVTPYWETLDGTVVLGTTAIKTVRQGIQ